ncbi:hypothetical protein ACFYNM_23005 [Streptomyces spororaveus]|uniref:phage tail protein n=1 Tax=Streptomyces spororaveus TaxID=284039 RepID=UPI0036A1EC54
MAMTIGELVANIRADNSDFDRGLATSQLRMQGFTVDASGRLRNLQGHFVRSGEVMERAVSEVTDEVSDLARQTTETTAVVEVETRTMAMRFRALARAADQMGDSLANRLGRAVGHLGNMSVNTDRLGAIGGRLGGLAMTFGKIGAGIGSAVPLVAGLAATVGQIAPAAGLAVTGLIAVQLATKALKIGMVGVSDAMSAAMDPSDPEAYAEALKKLSPNARAFVGEIRTLQPELKALQQHVQQNLFEGLDGVLKDLGKTTLPVLREGLGDAATSLNSMGRALGEVVSGLSTSGVLGTAISGANAGLWNLSRIPAQIVNGLVEIGAAAAPAFGRLTDAVSTAADEAAVNMSDAFADGRMEQIIEDAITVFKQLWEVAKNVGSIIRSVFSAAHTTGGDFLGVLTQITGALATAFASPAVQGALKAIYSTMATLASTVGPLLVTALQAIAPVFTALGPPIQRLIQTLGPILGQVIGALGPVLAVAATAVGSLLDAVSPLLPVIGTLVAGLLPALTPLLTLVAGVFQRLAPLVSQLAGILMSALTPILAALLPALTPIVDSLLTLADAIMPIISAQMTAFAPLIAQLAGTFAQLLVALAPVIASLIVLVANVLTQMTPILTTVIGFVSRLAAVFAGELATVIQTVVIPAFQMIAALLSGDFSGAWAAAKTMVSGIIDSWIRIFRDLPAKASEALSGLAGAVWSKVSEAGGRMVDSLKEKRSEALDRLRELPGKAKDALGDLGSLLWSSGRSLVSGFIDGIKSMIGSVKDAASKVVSGARDYFPFSPAKEGPFSGKGWTLFSGQALAQGFADGIGSRAGVVARTMGQMLQQAQDGFGTLDVPGMAGAHALGGIRGLATTPQPVPVQVTVTLDGPESMTRLIRDITATVGGGVVQTAFGSY